MCIRDSSILSGVLLLIPGFFAMNLRTQILAQHDPIDHFAMIRALLRGCAAILMLGAVASTAFGYAISLLAQYCSNYVFGIFVYTVGSAVIAFEALFCLFLASGSKSPQTVQLIKLMRWLQFLTVLGLVALIVATGTSFQDIRSSVESNWGTISKELQKHSSWNDKSMDTIISTLRWNRIFMEGLCIMLLTLLVSSFLTCGKFLTYVDADLKAKRDKQQEDGEDELVMEHELGCTQRAMIAWACVVATFQLFWEGQYLMFSQWVSQGGSSDATNESWFVWFWEFMGDVDQRYQDEDETVFVLKVLIILICLLYTSPSPRDS
eukprot:TRINITY_DN55538_c0_g1_i2.p1 TRINITY_DN55538_c0_g1~~TRINITY_DN55538_c0_g1_i2.p1  ORF type:complete len:321 (-),score=91.32 TRINITY_DN55538_c0_g1_i2:137-1099(-)